MNRYVFVYAARPATDDGFPNIETLAGVVGGFVGTPNVVRHRTTGTVTADDALATTAPPP